MKVLSRFHTFTFLVVLFAIGINAQVEPKSRPESEAKKATTELPEETSFSDLLNLGPKKIKGLKLGQLSPNELTGLKFAASGPLSTIRAGLSDRTNIIKAFGTDCDDPCKLNSTWRVSFEYYKENSGRILIIIDNEGQHSFALVPRKEYLGNVSKIVLIPTHPISVKPPELTDAFARNCVQPFSDGFQLEGQKLKKEKIEFLVGYYDQYGLEYTVNDGSNIKTCDYKVKRRFARVQRITYSIPRDLEMKEVLLKIPSQ